MYSEKTLRPGRQETAKGFPSNTLLLVKAGGESSYHPDSGCVHTCLLFYLICSSLDSVPSLGPKLFILRPPF